MCRPTRSLGKCIGVATISFSTQGPFSYCKSILSCLFHKEDLRLGESVAQISQSIDLEAYTRRIGYEGERQPSLETLSALHLLHPLTIAFENLDPLLDRPVNLDLESLQRKLLFEKRGGYCFEQNLLFMAALRSIGFQVAGLAARVLWNYPDDRVSPRTHMLLRVDLPDGSWIADVGFGGLTLTAPIRLMPDLVQETPHETFRLERDGDGFRVLALINGIWRAVYQFGMEEQFQVDYEITNFYLSTNPASRFRNELVVARPTQDGRYALLNRRLNAYGLAKQGPRELTSPKEIESILQEVFGITVPDRSAFFAALQEKSIF